MSLPPDQSRWLTWPSRDFWIAFLNGGICLSVLWIVVYGGASWLTSRHTFRIRVHLSIEEHMPFLPAAAVVYLSLFPMLWLAPFILQTAGKVHQLARSLAWLFVISGVCFLCLPVADKRAKVVAADDVLGQLYMLADWLNLQHNYIPSLHVGMATLCYCMYAERAPRGRKWLLGMWSVAIAVSTLLIHEHFLADILTGAMLGWLVARAAHARILQM